MLGSIVSCAQQWHKWVPPYVESTTVVSDQILEIKRRQFKILPDTERLSRLMAATYIIINKQFFTIDSMTPGRQSWSGDLS